MTTKGHSLSIPPHRRYHLLKLPRGTKEDRKLWETCKLVGEVSSDDDDDDANSSNSDQPDDEDDSNTPPINRRDDEKADLLDDAEELVGGNEVPQV